MYIHATFSLDPVHTQIGRYCTNVGSFAFFLAWYVKWTDTSAGDRRSRKLREYHTYIHTYIHKQLQTGAR